MTESPATSSSDLARTIEESAHLLPAQGPIGVFIHHNTLHSLEHLPFERAVEQAAAALGCEPYLPEVRYRDKLASGRIAAAEVEKVLAAELGASAAADVAGLGPRIALWRAVVLYGLPEAAGRELDWLLAESPVLARFRPDLPAAERAALHRPEAASAAEQRAVARLWQTCRDAVARTPPPPSPPRAEPLRRRDAILQAGGPDTDAWIHPPLIRFLAGYLDLGLAPWTMPGRGRGLHGCFLELYAAPVAAWCARWAPRLRELVADDRRAGRGPLASIEHSLAGLGVGVAERAAFLSAELLALRGWAGMIRQLERGARGARVPAARVPTVRDYLAVRLLLQRAAAETAARDLGVPAPPGSESPAPTPTERAWPVFKLAQLLGLDPEAPAHWSAETVAAIEGELAEINGLRCRRILHQAFERTSRHLFYDALVQHRPPPPPRSPAFQAVFCLDEREESFRRHLEEADAECETFSTAGFYNIAMTYQGLGDAHPRPLCPAPVRPGHFVREVALGESAPPKPRRAAWSGFQLHSTSRGALGGALFMTLFGWMALVPLVLRVVFPWLNSRWRHVRAIAEPGPSTRLRLEGEPGGFTVGEMADIVRQVLEDTGLGARLAPLVFILGHGSHSLNNPHESAHDCGACGGGRGGPNARAFAQMANDPRVRARLAAAGLAIPPGVWFIGGMRNTCDNQVSFFDTDLVPESARGHLARARAAFDCARRHEAHERCRRFDVPAWYPPLAALAHVQGRAADLAQSRPEYGHATNALCLFGPRAHTRGLFLDRRAFLTSYDPDHDPDGSILTRILNAAVPVCAGISLEYYFSYVDPTGYGSGTKLPHNVTSLLGVMDGAQSDLRSGLPWQMVEIHEPIRLSVVIEASRERVSRILAANPGLARLVHNRWLWLACLEGSQLWELGASGYVLYKPMHPLPVIAGDSAAWYQGKRGYVPPASIVPAAAASRTA